MAVVAAAVVAAAAAVPQEEPDWALVVLEAVEMEAWPGEVQWVELRLHWKLGQWCRRAQHKYWFPPEWGRAAYAA